MKTPCPEDETFADYLEGRLSEKERFELERHVSACEICLDQLVIARNILFGSTEMEIREVPPEVTEAAVQIVRGRLAKKARTRAQLGEKILETFSSKVSEPFRVRPWGEALIQPVRGADAQFDGDIIRVLKTYTNFDAELDIERKGGGRFGIRVVVSPRDRTQFRLRVKLIQGKREIASELTEKDIAVFEDIPFGRYQLLFQDRGTLLGTYAFEITEAGCGEREE